VLAAIEQPRCGLEGCTVQAFLTRPGERRPLELRWKKSGSRLRRGGLRRDLLALKSRATCSSRLTPMAIMASPPTN